MDTRYYYYIDINEINMNNIDTIDFSRLGLNVKESLKKFMFSKYDTHLGKDNVFRVSDEYSDNIYDYRIRIYKIDSSYIKFKKRYGNIPQPIFISENNKFIIENTVIELEPDIAKFLRQSLIDYGMNIAIDNTKDMLELMFKQSEKSINIMNEYLDEIEEDYRFIRPLIILDEDVSTPVKLSYKMIIGEYDISEVVDLEDNKLRVILNNLITRLTDNIHKDYYISTSDTSLSTGLIYINRREKDLSTKEYKRNLWSAMFESDDLFCGMNYNIRDLYYDKVVEYVDLTNEINKIPNRELLTEAKKIYNGKYSPVYIVLTNTHTLVSKVITSVTKSPYNHASISFDPDLDKLYSFSGSGKNEFGKGGFVIENIKRSYLESYDNVTAQVYAVFVTNEQLKQMNLFLDKLLLDRGKKKYNYIGLISYLLKKPLKRENHKFCSEFVDEIFKLVNIDLTNKKSGLVEPYDFAKRNLGTIFKVFEGPLEIFDSKRISTFTDKAFSRSRFALEESHSRDVNDTIEDNRFVKGYIDPRPDHQYNAKELKDGTEIELEHVSDKYYSKMIAKDHLDKDPDYYKKLIKMETENDEFELEERDKVLLISRLNGTELDIRPDSDYNQHELQIGIRIEHEHTNNYDIAKVIAKDHLDEFANYYTLMYKYDLIDINRDIESISHNILQEAKSFPVQFDDTGNLLIKNMKKINYQMEYENSHRLLLLYDKNKNIEGMKYELSKLWFINSLIEDELYSRVRPNNIRRKELIDIRARVLNDFNKYLPIVTSLERKFNFSQYYDTTPFSDAEIKINKSTIDGIGRIIKSGIGMM